MTREITIVTPEHAELTFELAGIGSRFVAMLVDTLLQALGTIILGLLVFFLTLSAYRFDVTRMSPWVIGLVFLLLFTLWSGYFLYFEVKSNGQTPGKKSAGIRVILDTGHPIDFRAAVLRNIMRFVDSLPGTYSIGIVSMFFSPQYRRLGDYVAGTLVVKTGKQHDYARPGVDNTAEVSPPTGMIAEQVDAAAAALPQECLPYLGEITKDEYRAVRYFIGRRPELDESVAHDLASKLASPLAAKLHLDAAGIEDPVAFLESLACEWERRMIR